MRASIAFSIAALAGTTFAAPSYGKNKNVEVVKNYHYVVETVVQTVYVTEGDAPAATPTPSPTPQPAYEVYTTVVEQAKPKPTSAVYKASTPVYKAPAASSPAAVYSTVAAPAASSAAPAPSSNGYMAIVEEWRSKLGLKQLACDETLEKNAIDTVTSSNGQMIHKLNPGTYGQVLAPGSADDFEHVFVGGWLCEIPSLPGLDGVCATQSNGWSYNGQTGHAEILSSTAYTKIGCALRVGIWCCDLGY